MAMNKTILGAAMRASIEAVSDKTDRVAVFEAMAQAIIDHIKLATITVTVTSVAGVTTGPGVSGPGVGTATIV